MLVLVKLDVADPVKALNASAVPAQLQQRFWRGKQAGEIQVLCLKGLAVTAASGRHLNDPAGGATGLAMCVGACLTRRGQVISRPRLIYRLMMRQGKRQP